jgi:hypothetical protein
MSIETTYISGLDLGQVSDFSALVTIKGTRYMPPEPQVTIVDAAMGKTTTFTELLPKAPDKPTLRTYQVLTVFRWPNNTSYTRISETLVKGFEKPPLRGTPLVVDHTGVGRAMFDMLQRDAPKCRLIPVTITAGDTMSLGSDGWKVAKSQLVSIPHVLIASDRLKLDRKLAYQEVLMDEIKTFQVKLKKDSTHASFEAWREGAHDDLVLALALACWAAEKANKQYWIR